MTIPSAAAAAAQAPVRDAPVLAKNPPPPSAPATVPQAAASVTISHGARLAAAASAPPAPTAVVRAAFSTHSVTQTTTTQYVAKVRAVLARGGTANLNQIMATLGIPQAEQVQVAVALGAAPKSAH